MEYAVLSKTFTSSHLSNWVWTNLFLLWLGINMLKQICLMYFVRVWKHYTSKRRNFQNNKLIKLIVFFLQTSHLSTYLTYGRRKNWDPKLRNMTFFSILFFFVFYFHFQIILSHFERMPFSDKSEKVFVEPKKKKTNFVIDILIPTSIDYILLMVWFKVSMDRPFLYLFHLFR